MPRRHHQAVIFDFGGVITSSPFDAFNRLESNRGLPHNFVRQVNSRNPDSNAWARLERAEIDAAAFDRLFAAEARELGGNLAGAEVLSVVAGEIRPEMVEALDRLKGEGLRLGCITNNAPIGEGAAMAPSSEAARDYAAVFARFDHVIESARAGVRKPDPRIYAMMCEALAVAPEVCVYLDDLGINCKPAAAMGMTAIKVTSAEQVLRDLGSILDLDLERG